MDWKKWRSEGLGASDAPVVMDVSPWKTRYQLWEEKLGLNTKDEGGNWATRRGNELEPKARAHYELLHDIDMPVKFVQHSEFSFIRASLDGYNEEKQLVLEIKCPGKDDHETAKNGKIPEKYYPQLQHQLLASGANAVHYYSFDGESGHLVVVKPDMAYIARLLTALIDFWQLIQNKTPPDLNKKDFKTVKDEGLSSLIQNWNSLKNKIEELTTEQKNIREEIISKLPHENVICADTKIYKVFRKGNIDYSKIPQLDGLDLDQYRKKGSSHYCFDPINKKP